MPLTSFVGREREAAEVERRLASSRLVTLTGPPGVGKTRLALRVAAGLGDDFADGARFVPLAPLREPELVVSAIAAAMGAEAVPAAERRPLLDRVADALRDRRLLLVLDNFEHVAAAAPRVAELLEACPRLAVLVTSRTRLRLRGECEVVVPPLTLPGTGEPSRGPGDPTSLADRSEAARLFVERAREAGNDLGTDGESAAAIAEICRRVDGLPLAIELAAAWCKVLAPPALLKRLTGRLAFLTAGGADLPPRQQTLRAAIDWSHDLLAEPERALFRRLGVFAGGFSAEAAEAITGATLETLTMLLDASLLNLEERDPDDAGAGPRFGMLETVRDYARGDGDYRWARELVEAALAEFRGLGNRAGLSWMLRDLAILLHWFEGDCDAAQPLLEEGLALAREVGDLPGVCQTLGFLADVGRVRGEHGRAAAYLDQALAALRRWEKRAPTPDRGRIDWNRAFVLQHVGLLERARGADERAVVTLEQAHALIESGNLRCPLASIMVDLGGAVRGAGDLRRARALLVESLTIAERHGYRLERSQALRELAELSWREGDRARARSHLDEALALQGEIGARREAAVSLSLAGVLVVEEGAYAAGSRLLGAAAGAWAYLDGGLHPAARAARERAIGVARAALGEVTHAGVWQAGRAMPLDQALACALKAEEPR